MTLIARVDAVDHTNAAAPTWGQQQRFHSQPPAPPAGELTTRLMCLLRSPCFRGMDETVLAPGLDAGGTSRRCLTDILARAFQAAA